jgi:hypothetical protein
VNRVNFDSEFATNALIRLGQLIKALDVAMCVRRRELYTLSTIDSVLVDLGRRVSFKDGLGVDVGSEEELVFRTARLIAISQLERIKGAILRIESDRGCDGMPAGLRDRFLSAIPVAMAELERLTQMWLPHRDASEEPSPARAQYRAAVQAAICELDRLDQIPDVERLLYRGVASVKWPAIAAACEQILVATHVRVDFESARRLWQARRWSGLVAGPP